jgi:hypothetical protein
MPLDTLQIFLLPWGGTTTTEAEVPPDGCNATGTGGAVLLELLEFACATYVLRLVLSLLNYLRIRKWEPYCG